MTYPRLKPFCISVTCAIGPPLQNPSPAAPRIFTHPGGASAAFNDAACYTFRIWTRRPRKHSLTSFKPSSAAFPPSRKTSPRRATIDFLQIRNGAIHILDYKPDATTGKPFPQLTLYALALSHLTGIPLFDFKCAWFNERQYCEFFPRTILARKNAR